MSEESISRRLVEAFLLAIDQFKHWDSHQLDEPFVMLPSGLGDKISIICRMVEPFDDEMTEEVLRIVRPLWDEVSFGEEMRDRSFSGGARLLRNRTEMRQAVYRAQHEAKGGKRADEKPAAMPERRPASPIAVIGIRIDPPKKS
jgi:hypothetical protein